MECSQCSIPSLGDGLRSPYTPIYTYIFYHLYRFLCELKFMVFRFFQTSGRRIINIEFTGDHYGVYEAEIDGEHIAIRMEAKFLPYSGW